MNTKDSKDIQKEYKKSIEEFKDKILKLTKTKLDNPMLGKHFDNLIKTHETILESLYKDLHSSRENKINKILES